MTESHRLEMESTKVFGFWVYLMTDLIIFAVLFAAFIVLRNNTFGGPSAKELFKIPPVFAETIFLLTSSFTCSLVTLSTRLKKRNWAVTCLLLTFALGLSFLVFEIREFAEFFEEGAGWQHSAFLSSYFALVGTHGLHVSFGLLWMMITIVIFLSRGILDSDISRVTCLSLFWHFLDIVWIYIFTVVYAMGILQ